MQSFIIEKNQAGQRLDKFLHKYLPQASTGFLYKMLRKKNITLNGKKAEGKEILQLNDEIRCFFSEETFAKFSGCSMSEDTGTHDASKLAGNGGTTRESMSTALVNEADTAFYTIAFAELSGKGISVIYEDENVLVLNKPAGILTQRSESKEPSLNEWMIGYLLQKQKITASELKLFKPSVCNRLDRNTSGLVLCGISLTGSQVLSELIRDRAVRKFYRTICIGEIKEKATINGSLTKDHKTNTVTITSEGAQIQTGFTPVKALSQEYTYLEVQLITGKTHQIRAHLASIGHALIGDRKYGSTDINQQFGRNFGLKYQLLHAYRLEFPELTGPLSDLSNKVLLAPLPEQFETILKELS